MAGLVSGMFWLCFCGDAAAIFVYINGPDVGHYRNVTVVLLVCVYSSDGLLVLQTESIKVCCQNMTTELLSD